MGIIILVGNILPANAQHLLKNELEKAISLSKESPDTAFMLLREIYNKAQDEKERVVAARCLRQMGVISYYFGHYAQSLDFHLQASEAFAKEGQDELLAANYNDLGSLYYHNKQEPLARPQYDKALAIYSRFQNQNGLGDTYGRIGHLYEKRQMYDSAFYFQRQAFYHYEVTGNKSGLAKINENLGSIFEDLGRFDSARHYFNRALELHQQLNNKLAIIEVENNLGDILRKTGHYSESLVQSGKALQLSLEANDPYQQSSAYRDLAKAWNLLGHNDSAFYYLELSRAKLSDIYSIENSKQVAFLQVMSETGKKNAEIERLRLGHRNTVILSIAGIIVVVLLVVVGLLVISRQRLKIRNEKALQMQNLQRFESQKALMEADLRNKELQENNLKQDLDLRARELSTYTLHIIQKNQLLEELRERLEGLVKEDKRDQKKQLQQLIHQINQNFNHDQYWGEFRGVFEQVHQSFLNNLKKYADNLTSNDLKLVSLIKMNLSPTDISTLLGISPDSLKVARYRLRKKINMPREENLNAFIQGL
ncbi:tetratricopeptide repeat protein [Filimonas effusa]|uniref:tetratricopeptide repeat protein n=1 Tax=Filimonas effusa TaxID=2508721 RepID=UPI0013E90358|nr:tetratricopeptide repeat protein [Filimonas effusa]